MTQENQNNELNNLFIHDLYDNLGRVKRVLNDILEEYTERKEEEEEEEEEVDMLLYEVTIHKITHEILNITYGYRAHSCDHQKGEQIENIESEIKFSISDRFVGYNETKQFSFPYRAYDIAMSKIIDLYLNDKDIKKSEDYSTVLDFLVKTLYIRGY